MRWNLFGILLLFTCRTLSQEEDPCRYIPPGDSPVTGPIPSSLTTKKKPPINQEASLLFSLLREQHAANMQQRPVCKMSYRYSYLAELTLKQKRSEVRVRVFDETGHEWLQDSALHKDRDLLRIQGNLSGEGTGKKLKATVNTLLGTQKFPAAGAISDSAGPRKITESSFFSPGSLLISGGCVMTIDTENRIDLGIVAGKLTWISNKKLYDMRKTDVISGVERNRAVLIEGGISLQSSLKIERGPFCWENQTLLFADVMAPLKPDVEFRNNLRWRAGKKVRTSLQTRYTYDRKRIPPALFEGEIGLGFYLEKKTD